MKKTVAVLMTALGLCLVYPAPQADAGFNWGKVLDEVIDVVADDGGSSYANSGRYREIALDGTYYQGKGNAAYNKNNEIISVNGFTLNEPAIIDIHAVTYIEDNASSFSFTLYDEDENQINDKIYICDFDTKDATLVLPAGKYKINVMYHCVMKKGYGEYKFKVNQTPVSVTTNQKLARPERAHQIYFGENTFNYMKDTYEYKNEYQYYSFDLQQKSNVRIYGVKIGGNGSMEYSILDEDERVIDKYYMNDDVIDETVILPKGKYYLRVERSYRTGIAYQLRISG